MQPQPLVTCQGVIDIAASFSGETSVSSWVVGWCDTWLRENDNRVGRLPRAHQHPGIPFPESETGGRSTSGALHLLVQTV